MREYLQITRPIGTLSNYCHGTNTANMYNKQ
ncbi:MAG: hypothetical protein ACI9J5_002439 [Paraglaciecola sp.]|jgi:hypothetical protein